MFLIVYSELKDSDISELIRMVGVVHKKANSEIVPILKKLQKDKNIELTEKEEETLDTWSKPIENLEKRDTYKAAKPFIWIVRNWFER